MSGAGILISLLNDAAVSIFGGLLSASFCGALDTRRRRLFFWLGMALMLLPQGAVYLLRSAQLRLQLYPLIVHLPLFLLLCGLTKRRLWPLISILSAYLFCQMRRWPALLAAALLPEAQMTQQLTELAFTLPLLYILLRFASPAIRQLMDYPLKTQCQFGSIPALYYAFDYLTRIYTDLLYSDSPVVLEFMPTVCCGAYLIFLLHNSAEERQRRIFLQGQDNLKLQVAQAAREISSLRESQAQAARYRHDLRHHLQYILACTENGQADRAKSYITGICAELEAQQVRQYCRNEAVNLILSAFVKRGADAGVELEIAGDIPDILAVSDNDLCVVLSNALENALHACRPLAEAGERCIIRVELRFQPKNSRLFLRIKNPCRGEVRLENGVPVSTRPGHGIGVQSILAVVERYGGGCTFMQENGEFVLQLFL